MSKLLVALFQSSTFKRST